MLGLSEWVDGAGLQRPMRARDTGGFYDNVLCLPQCMILFSATGLFELHRFQGTPQQWELRV